MSFIAEIKERYISVESARNEMQGRIDLLHEQKDKADERIDAFATKYKHMERVVGVLQKYSKAKEQVLREKLDNIVTKGLRFIFGEGYRSKLEFGINRGQATIKPKIITEIDGKELEAEIADAHGGGLVDVTSFIYRMLVLSLVKPRRRRVLFLDECFKHLSEEYLEPAGMFMKQLSEKLGIQLIIITHKKQLMDIGDVVYEFSNTNGITEVQLVGE